MVSSTDNHAGQTVQRAMVDVHSRPITIMLVDDDPDCRMLIRDAISEGRLNNDVIEATNGCEALKILRDRAQRNELPGLIYMDIEMPHMNGIETLKNLKDDPQLKHIPVVMMTGLSDETQMRRAAELGANSYTLKPSSAEQFLQTVIASTTYWLAIHQYPEHHLPQSACKR